MKFTQIRNATAIIEYNGVKFLLDPYLSPKGTYEGFPGTINSDKRQPSVELPMPISEIINQTDCVIVTHTHLDHWDDAASEHLPKDIKIFAQDGHNTAIEPLQDPNEPTDNTAFLKKRGFKNITTLNKNVEYSGVTITPITIGQHGDAEIYSSKLVADRLGDAMGVVLQSPSEPTVYIVGDTIWTKGVAQTLRKYQPDVTIINAGDAQSIDSEGQTHSIIMNEKDFIRIHEFAPQTLMIATHMEAVNHTTLSRKDLRQYVDSNGIGKSVLIPNDGETINVADQT